MKLRFLGTGTSTGVPQLGCNCEVCKSSDPRDRRLRTSALITLKSKNLLIDCGPDFREQILQLDSPPIDAVLITHEHYDHTGGIDDLRPYSYGDTPLILYGDSLTTKELKRRQPYCFGESTYPGVPQLELRTIREEKFHLDDLVDIEIEPLQVSHGRLPVTGYRIGFLSYITDCFEMPAKTLQKIMGSKVLVINALRFEPHGSHQNIDQALSIIEKVRPQTSYLIHMSHGIGLHKDTERILPSNVHLAFDGLEIEIPEFE